MFDPNPEVAGALAELRGAPTFQTWTYDVARDAFHWQDHSRASFLATVAAYALFELHRHDGRFLHEALGPATMTRRAVADGLVTTEVMAVQREWSAWWRKTKVRRADGAEIDPVENADDAAWLADLTVTPSSEEIHEALRPLCAAWPRANPRPPREWLRSTLVVVAPEATLEPEPPRAA